MDTAFELLSSALLLSFVLCCIASGFLQVRAWGRHARPGVPVSLRALRDPEQFFDPIGYRQMLLARRLLSVGGVAYLTYGLLIIANNFW
jgi:hypothetical protein